MSSGNTGSGDWTDRRGLFQKGKELHSPSSPTGRKFSETGVTNAVRRASTSSNNGDDKGAQFPTAAPRRRSSAASGGMFGGLNQMKRGSQDYGDKRASHQEMSGAGGGMFSGWYNSTFKGAGAGQKPGDSAQK